MIEEMNLRIKQKELRVWFAHRVVFRGDYTSLEDEEIYLRETNVFLMGVSDRLFEG